MGATSNHYGDIANWVEKVIDSCENSLQEISARKLVRLYEKQYSYLETSVYFELCRRLNNKLDNKFYSRVEKQLEEHKKK